MSGAAVPETTTNIASHLPAMARRVPDVPAIIAPKGRGTEQLTFRELDALSDTYARAFEQIGITRGVRTVLMAPPSLDFFALVFALLKVGAVMVMIDPGIRRDALLKCLSEAEAGAFIGVPKAHLARLLFPGSFKTVKAFVTVGGFRLWGGWTSAGLRRLGGAGPYTMAVPTPGETAAILFTSGSTGIPKGAVYTHEMFDAQVRSIKQVYGIEPGEIDLPTFPLFALFDPALGMTSVLPRMDFRFPGKADPAVLVEAITTHRCTMMFGSPSLVDNLGRYCSERKLTLATLRRVVSAGAPVRTDVLERMASALTGEAQIFTPFGATESLPVSSIGSREVLAETGAATALGQGVCVGRPVEGGTVRVIRISDEPIEAWSDELIVPQGTIGEITVRGPVVSREYWARPEQTKAAKIREGDAIVHRMGDVGAFDAQGRLWMCGRKGHRVVDGAATHFTVPIEEILNTHPAVKRTALVGVGAKGAQRPLILIEREPGVAHSDAQVVQEVLALAAGHAVTRPITEAVIYPGAFPVDARHNAKIERERLTVWASSRGVGT